MVCHGKLRYNNKLQRMLLLKNNEIMPIQVAEHLNFALHGVSINEPLNIERGRFDNNRIPRGAKVLFIEQENKIRASITFDDVYDYDLNSKEYVENKESNEEKRK